MRKLCIFLLGWVALLLPLRIFGSHAMGTDITYDCLGNNQYRITVSFYRDCSGIAAPASITVNYFSDVCNIPQGTYSASLTLQSSREVSPLCASQLPNSSCNGGILPGVQQFIYSAVITLPASCPDWVVGFSECCRNNAITNLQSAASYNLFVYATINNANAVCSNSPEFTTLPVPYICAGVPFNYNHGAVDTDGDSLVYTLIPPLDNYGAQIPYTGSYGINNPLSTTGGFSFDSTTGQMSFTPSMQQVAVVTVQVDEYRNGIKVGSTIRDIQLVVISSALCTNQPPVIPTPMTNVNGGGLIDNSTVQMCPNTQLTFDIVVTDPNGDNILLTSNASGVNGAIPGSSFTVSGIGSTVTGHFSWTPTVADTGFHPFQVTYYDNGCPVSSPQTVTYVVYVFDRVVGGADQVYCGDSIQLNAIGGTYFSWTPWSGLTDPNIHNPVATPVRPTMYYVSSDCGVDSVFVDVQPPYTLNAGRDTAICLNSLVQLNATVSHIAYGPYSFKWTPDLGLSQNDVADPIASPLTTTTYHLTSTSAQGCIRQDTLIVAISGVAPNVIAYADPDTVCPGETVRLEINTAPTSCGISITPCNNQADEFTAGIGTIATEDGTPYGGYWEDGRVQFLYRAYELNALGISGGTITQLAFRVADKQSGIPYNNFTIKMGCTSKDQLNGPSFETNVTSVVYGPTAYTTALGWNTHILSSPYDWDGASNLIIEVCFDNLDFTQYDDIYYTATPFTSVAFDRDDDVSGCVLSSPTFGSKRPNTRFSICQQSVSAATINWTPSDGIQNPNSANTTAQVFGTTTFIANLSLGGCTGQGYVTVKVDTTVTVEARQDTSLCYPAPVQLNATPFGTPSAVQLNCGVNGTPVSTSVIFGVGSSANFSSNPTPYSGGYDDGRIQMLFRKSELNAISMDRGTFTSLAFNVAFKNTSQPFKGFTIKMGCTNLDVLGNSFASGLEVVFNPKDVNTTPGWNTYNLDSPYDWDGLSNIIVEVCFDNNGATIEDIVYYTATTYNSVLYARANNSAGCNLSSPVSSTSRMNIRFGESPPPAGVFTYSWSPPIWLNDTTVQNPISNPSDSITYTVTVTDGSCYATDSVKINFYTSFDVNVYGTNVGCNGSFDGNAVSLPVGGVPPYNFIWSTGRMIGGVPSDTLYSLYAGTYRITVTDNNGCDASDSVVIMVPPPLDVSISARNISCFGGANGAALAFGSGGTMPYDFLWSIGDTTPLSAQLTAGTYYLTLTDASGCTITSSMNISEPLPITSSVTVTDASCYKYNDGSASVSVVGGISPYTYFWSNNQTTAIATGLSGASYFVTVTDDSNCLHVDSAIIGQPDSFGIVTTAVDVSCFGYSDGSASASVLGDTVNYQFSWNTTPQQNRATVAGLAAGTVTVLVTDTAGCSISSDVLIGTPFLLTASASATDISCFGLSDGSAVVAAGGGTVPYNYLWNNSVTDSSISLLPAGNYSVTVTDVRGCSESDTVAIIEPAEIVINDSIINATCFGLNDGRILANVSGGIPSFSFFWSDSQSTPIASNLEAGNYSVTVVDRNGCRDSLLNILISQPTDIHFGNIDITPPCAGQATGAILFSSSGGIFPHQYSLDNSPPQTDAIFNDVAEGGRLLTIIDENGCTADTNILIIPYDTLQVNFDTALIQINIGQEVTLNPIIQPDSPDYIFSWTPSTGLSCVDCRNPVANPLIRTPYTVTVFDENGCPNTAQIVLDVTNSLIFMVPNAFSPNGDGENDILYVYGISLASVKFKIFDRWGEKLFETENLGEGWNGSYGGEMQPPGVYVYFAEAVFQDGQEKQVKGSVTILK